MVLPMEVEKSSQLSTETRHNNGDNMQRKLAIPRVTLRGDMTRPPSLPHDPLVTLHDDSYLKSLGHDQLFSYAHACCDTIRDMWRVHDPRDTE